MKIILPNKKEFSATRAFKSYVFESGKTQLSITFIDVTMEELVEEFTKVPVKSITISRSGFANVTYDKIKVTSINENIDDVTQGVNVTIELK